MGLLNLPAIPAELKSVTPYLQRADEVKNTDPVISYWCAYHAAQLGISLKLKDTNARSFLFDLLGALERMKAEIGPNDAIDDESASSAYVENFALRVFAMADNEDRKGNATRGTAKKFLAAANFLEVLSVVSSSNPSTINIPEKIRYAKWKAADIAKAFREGRKPTPGGIGEQLETTAEEAHVNEEPFSPPSLHRDIPPPGPITDLPSSIAESHVLPPGFTDVKATPTSPGEWSTVSNPGASISQDFTPPPRRAWVSEDVEGQDSDVELVPPPVLPDRPHISPASSDSSAKKVHFTPSVTGGLTPSIAEGNPFASAQIPSAPPADILPSTPETTWSVDHNSLPPGFVPSPVQPPPSLPPPHISPPPISPTAPPPPLPILSYPIQPQPQVVPPPGVVSMDATITTTPEELTPQLVTRVQKHCRYAISALDYEDAEQARKELRAALNLLGG
ncbi:DUF605-domain-containing protein [Trametopsis cervina]|nr:DUF605-domain-containing protein [Trametopsis cervina]